VNGNPLLKAPSTVNNKPIHGAKVRFRTVVSAIAIQCTPKRKCFRVIERPPCGLPSDDFADVLVLGHSEICNFLPPRDTPGNTSGIRLICRSPLSTSEICSRQSSCTSSIHRILARKRFVGFNSSQHT